MVLLPFPHKTSLVWEFFETWTRKKLAWAVFVETCQYVCISFSILPSLGHLNAILSKGSVINNHLTCKIFLFSANQYCPIKKRVTCSPEPADECLLDRDCQFIPGKPTPLCCYNGCHYYCFTDYGKLFEGDLNKFFLVLHVRGQVQCCIDNLFFEREVVMDMTGSEVVTGLQSTWRPAWSEIVKADMKLLLRRLKPLDVPLSKTRIGALSLKSKL